MMKTYYIVSDITVTADVEDNDAHLRREGSSLKRMCFNVSLQMSAKVMIYKL